MGIPPNCLSQPAGRQYLHITSKKNIFNEKRNRNIGAKVTAIHRWVLKEKETKKTEGATQHLDEREIQKKKPGF